MKRCEFGIPDDMRDDFQDVCDRHREIERRLGGTCRCEAQRARRGVIRIVMREVLCFLVVMLVGVLSAIVVGMFSGDSTGRVFMCLYLISVAFISIILNLGGRYPLG